MEYSTSNKILMYLRFNNKTQNWLADKLNLSRPQLNFKIKKNNWHIWEIQYLKELGIIS